MPTHHRTSTRTGWWFSLPYIVYFLVFVAYPLAFSILLLFHRWNIVSPMEWVGLKNFQRLLDDPLFFQSIENTGLFLLIHIPLQIVVALGFAVLLNSQLRFRGFFRSLYFMPVVVSGVVVTILWQQLYAYDSGLLNRLLLVIGWSKVPWLVSPRVAMVSIALMATWKNVGIYIVLFLVGLQNIPRELYESASLEGAKGIRQFFSITLPLLNPSIVVVVVLSTVGGFSLFVEPYVMTGGGPMESTLSAVLYIYNQAFSFGHMGYATTLGFVFALFILIIVFGERQILESTDIE